MMQTQTLPTCDEYDPLDAHLEELEEPGTNFLQDFIVAPQSDTHSNGYTSEESDYSVVTPSDEQKYHDMSFLQSANTSELVDVVADLSMSDLTSVAPQQQQKFAGKVIKGKTSKYRGVTQTSKTSWGAKYSAKRITNTCKTPEEAAHAYDEYLKINYPQKFAKFANFCDDCGKFVNPLALPQFYSECECSSRSPTESTATDSSSMSPKKEMFHSQQISTPATTTYSLVPPTAPFPSGGSSVVSSNNALSMGNSTHSFDVNPADDESAAYLSRRSSNASVGSLKFSFSEDTEQFFAESYDDVAKISSDRGGIALENQSQQQDQKRDSLPMAVISSAVDSFTQEDNLDQIIKDINRSSSSHSLLKGSQANGRTANDSINTLTAAKNSSGKQSELEPMNNYGAQVELPATNSLDFDVDDLDELTKYFLSENDTAVVVQREMQTNPASMQQQQMMGTRNPQFKKIHSLDFDSDNTMTGSSRSRVATGDVKLEGTEMMDTFFVAPPPVNAAMIVSPVLPPPAIIEIQTQFLEKYWRNDRKNIQCFPFCPEHGDYYRVRIENLQHRCKGVCRAPVRAHVSIPAPAGASLMKPGMLVLARCNSTFSRNMALTEQRSLSLNEMNSLQGVSAAGVIDCFTSNASGVQFDVTFHPDVWKFEFDLPKKRRHVQSSSPAVSAHDGDAGADSQAAEFLYFFEIDVFYSREETTFERLGHTESMNFQIGNTRTLLRQRNKMVGEGHSSGGPLAHAGQNDNDKLMDVDELPEKKRVKVNLGREFLSGTSFSEDDVPSSRGTERKLSTRYITGEGFSSSSKQNLLEDKTTPMDVDEYCRSDSKDSIFNQETGSSELSKVKSDVWKDGDRGIEDLHQASTYRSYVSPKQKSRNVQTVDSPVATAIPMKFTTDMGVTIPSHAPEETYSLSKLLGYSFACVPLSILFLPVGILLLLGFVVVPPAAAGIVSALDSLSDMELSRANSSCTSRDQRLVLDRLVEEILDSSGKPKGGLFRYHGKGDVWGRIFYFSGGKFVVSMVSFIPTFVLSILVVLLYPIRPVSASIASAACSCALWSREYTREATGKPLAGGGQFDGIGGLV